MPDFTVFVSVQFFTAVRVEADDDAEAFETAESMSLCDVINHGDMYKVNIEVTGVQPPLPSDEWVGTPSYTRHVEGN